MAEAADVPDKRHTVQDVIEKMGSTAASIVLLIQRFGEQQVESYPGRRSLTLHHELTDRQVMMLATAAKLYDAGLGLSLTVKVVGMAAWLAESPQVDDRKDCPLTGNLDSKRYWSLIVGDKRLVCLMHSHGSTDWAKLDRSGYEFDPDITTRVVVDLEKIAKRFRK